MKAEKVTKNDNMTTVMAQLNNLIDDVRALSSEVMRLAARAGLDTDAGGSSL